MNCKTNKPFALAIGVAVAGLLLTGMAHAQEARSKFPDWSGLWRVKGSPALVGQEEGGPAPGVEAGPGAPRAEQKDDAPLKPEYEQQYLTDIKRAKRQGDPKASFDEQLTDTNTLNCFAGFPRLLAAPWSYEFLITPKQTYIIIDKAVRHIYTDGRDFPPKEAQWPLYLGRSTGHWEKDTLVIKTINMRDDMWLDPTPLMLSKEATVTERIHLSAPDTLEDKVTIHDPVKFTHDWNFTRHYQRSNSSDDWADDPELCGTPSDRNRIVNGRIITVLPGQDQQGNQK